VSDVTLDDALFLLSLPRTLRRQTPALRLCHGRHGFYVERDPETILGRPATRSLRTRTRMHARAQSRRGRRDDSSTPVSASSVLTEARALTAADAEALFRRRP
jgi:hypothetical protein